MKSSKRHRAKSSLRLRYDAEVRLIQKKLGDLESIRLRLGLSQRKMCQLLFVDPSAWTRWTKMNEDAPPHIYRMLQWYLALEDKYPALDPSFWLSSIARPVEAAEVEGLSKKVLELENRISEQSRTPKENFDLKTGVFVLSAFAIGFALAALLI